MDLRRLEIFAKVAELGSFSRAAEALFLTQPTISEHVRALEDELRKKFPVEINEAALSSVKLPEQLVQPGSAAQPDPAKPRTPQPEQAGDAAAPSSNVGK